MLITIFRWLAVASVACSSALAQSPVMTRDLGDGATEYLSARAIASAATEVPPADAKDWRAVELPLVNAWGHGFGSAQWYRVPIEKSAPNETYGIYLWRFSMNAAIYFNGEFLGDGGSFDEPIARNWNRPLYVTIPAALWKPSGNEVTVRLVQYPGFGFFGSPIVGPDRVLRARFEQQVFLQNDLTRVFAILTFGAGLFLFAFWMRRRGDRLYLYFSFAMFAWTVFSSNLFVRDLIMPAKPWWVLVHASIDWWMVLMTLFYHRLYGIRRIWVERVLVAFGIATTCVYLATDISNIPRFASRLHGGAILAALYLAAVVVWQSRITKDRDRWLHLLGLVALVTSAVHDWLFQLGAFADWWRGSFHFSHFTVPIFMLAITWHLTGRFIKALNEQERFNVELEQRVASASRELEQRYVELQAMRETSARTEERERIYRDLHDDVGAKLLSLIYRSSDAPQADLARSALQDLRDVVSRSHQQGLLLTDALADWRSECAQRLEAANCRLDWHQDEMPETMLSSLQVTHLGRILREAVSNAIRHANPRVVTVQVQFRDGELKLDVRDDGRAGDVAAWRSGRGVTNMQKRARELDGDIEWRALEPQGCGVLCRIPLTQS